MKATDFFSSLFCFAICIFAGQVNPRQGLGKELANPSFAFHSLFPRPSPVVLSNVVQYSFIIYAVFSHYMCSLPFITHKYFHNNFVFSGKIHLSIRLQLEFNMTSIRVQHEINMR